MDIGKKLKEITVVPQVAPIKQPQKVVPIKTPIKEPVKVP